MLQAGDAYGERMPFGALVVSHASVQAISLEELNASGCLDTVRRHKSSFFSFPFIALPPLPMQSFLIRNIPSREQILSSAPSPVHGITGNQPGSGSTVAISHDYEIETILRNAITSPTMVRAIILRMVPMPCTTLAPKAVTWLQLLLSSRL